MTELHQGGVTGQTDTDSIPATLGPCEWVTKGGTVTPETQHILDELNKP